MRCTCPHWGRPGCAGSRRGGRASVRADLGDGRAPGFPLRRRLRHAYLPNGRDLPAAREQGAPARFLSRELWRASGRPDARVRRPRKSRIAVPGPAVHRRPGRGLFAPGPGVRPGRRPIPATVPAGDDRPRPDEVEGGAGKERGEDTSLYGVGILVFIYQRFKIVFIPLYDTFYNTAFISKQNGWLFNSDG